MIEVRIRLASRGEAIHLCTCELVELDDLVPMLGKWGLVIDDPDSADDSDVTGQFRMTDTAAFFELTVHDNEDPTQ